MKLWVLLLALGSAGEEWYQVNSLGQPLRPLVWFQAGDHEWVVRRERKTQGDQLFLYRNGRLQERRERFFYEDGKLRQLSVYRDEIPVEEEYYDPLGKLTRSVSFSGAEAAEELEYQYREDALVKVTARDSRGTVLYFDEIFRNPDGRLRRVVRTQSDGTKGFYQWLYGSRGLVGEWSDSQDRQSFRYYTPEGKLRLKEDFEGGKSLGRQEWSLDSPEPVLRESAPGDVRSEAVTDSRGRLVRRDNYLKDVWTSREEWFWEGDNLVKEERIRPGQREVWTYTHADSGEILTETQLINGQKDHVSHYSGGSLVKQEIFDSQGEKALEAEYSGGRKIRETYWRGSEILRTRELLP